MSPSPTSQISHPLSSPSLSSPSSLSSSPQRISTDRTINALTWFRRHLSQQLSPSIATSLTVGLPPTSSTVSTIESLRPALEARAEEIAHLMSVSETQLSNYRKLETAFRGAGAEDLLSQLDPEAIAETLPLVEIGAALGLGPYEAASATKRVVAAGEVVEEYLRMADWVAERRMRVAEAQESLREGVTCRGKAWNGVETAKEIVSKRRRNKEKNLARLQRFAAKEREYDAKATELVERVKASGVQEGCKHETLVREGKELEAMEEKLNGIRSKLTRYEGLPANLAECLELEARLESEIVAVDKDINKAIQSLSC